MDRAISMMHVNNLAYVIRSQGVSRTADEYDQHAAIANLQLFFFVFLYSIVLQLLQPAAVAVADHAARSRTLRCVLMAPEYQQVSVAGQSVRRINCRERSGQAQVTILLFLLQQNNHFALYTTVVVALDTLLVLTYTGVISHYLAVVTVPAIVVNSC